MPNFFERDDEHGLINETVGSEYEIRKKSKTLEIWTQNVTHLVNASNQTESDSECGEKVEQPEHLYFSLHASDA